MYMQARNGLGEVDWSGLLKDVVTGVVAYKTADTQLDIAKAQQAQQLAQEQARQAMLAYQFSPQYSPQYSTMPQTQSNMMPLLLLGGAALLAFFMLKD